MLMAFLDFSQFYLPSSKPHHSVSWLLYQSVYFKNTLWSKNGELSLTFSTPGRGFPINENFVWINVFFFKFYANPNPNRKKTHFSSRSLSSYTNHRGRSGSNMTTEAGCTALKAPTNVLLNDGPIIDAGRFSAMNYFNHSPFLHMLVNLWQSVRSQSKFATQNRARTCAKI